MIIQTTLQEHNSKQAENHCCSIYGVKLMGLMNKVWLSRIRAGQFKCRLVGFYPMAENETATQTLLF